ncbi:MAG: glycosyltransferase family 39 protein [Chloroflexota bacterium]
MNFLKKFHWFEIMLIILVMGVHFYVAISASHNFASRWFTRDDAYYYFKVAQNISEGYGSTFDKINPTNGYHPLWMIICIPIFYLARFDLILPLRVLVLVMAIISSITSILLFRILRKQTGQIVAMLAASYWAFNLNIHSIVTQQGMETGLVALSVLLFLYTVQKLEDKDILSNKDLTYLGFMALFVLFSRLDSIYLVLIMGVWLVFRHTPIRYMLPLDLVFTFFVIVGAFIQRASLRMYLLAFDNSAMIFAGFTFVFQTIIFYFSGLYAHPKTFSRFRLFIITVLGVSTSAGFSILIMLIFSGTGKISIPRTVPFYYWLGMLILTYSSRILINLISPWPIRLSKQNKPFQGILSDHNHLKTALEPISAWVQKGFIYFGIILAGLVTYMATNMAFFGTFMPVSGQIKRWWGSMPNDVYGGAAKSVLDVFGVDPKKSSVWSLLTKYIVSGATKLSKLNGSFSNWYWIIFFVLCILVILLFLYNRKKNLRRAFQIGIFPLLISSVLHSFFYGAMAYSAKHEWYWVTQMLTIVILVSLAISMLLDIIPQKKMVALLANIACFFIILNLAYNFSSELINRMPYKDLSVGKPYMDTLPILEDHTEPGSLIGMTGGGNTGYFIQDRTIVNMDGLINSYAYFDALKTNQGGKFLKEMGLDYVFANRYIITSSMPYRYQFTPDELLTVPDAPEYGQKVLMQYIPAP